MGKTIPALSVGGDAKAAHGDRPAQHPGHYMNDARAHAARTGEPVPDQDAFRLAKDAPMPLYGRGGASSDGRSMLFDGKGYYWGVFNYGASAGFLPLAYPEGISFDIELEMRSPGTLLLMGAAQENRFRDCLPEEGHLTTAEGYPLCAAEGEDILPGNHLTLSVSEDMGVELSGYGVDGTRWTRKGAGTPLACLRLGRRTLSVDLRPDAPKDRCEKYPATATARVYLDGMLLDRIAGVPMVRFRDYATPMEAAMAEGTTNRIHIGGGTEGNRGALRRRLAERVGRGELLAWHRMDSLEWLAPAGTHYALPTRLHPGQGVSVMGVGAGFTVRAYDEAAPGGRAVRLWRASGVGTSVVGSAALPSALASGGRPGGAGDDLLLLNTGLPIELAKGRHYTLSLSHRGDAEAMLVLPACASSMEGTRRTVRGEDGGEWKVDSFRFCASRDMTCLPQVALAEPLGPDGQVWVDTPSVYEHLVEEEWFPHEGPAGRLETQGGAWFSGRIYAVRVYGHSRREGELIDAPTYSCGDCP